MKKILGYITSLVLVVGFNQAFAAGGVVNGPNVIAPDRYVYYPGTEVLAKDEVRVICCGKFFQMINRRL
jgi:ribonuclease Z